jgi:hypothetical protein
MVAYVTGPPCMPWRLKRVGVMDLSAMVVWSGVGGDGDEGFGFAKETHKYLTFT